MQKTALNICLLLLDVGLACHDATKSAVSSNTNSAVSFLLLFIIVHEVH